MANTDNENTNENMEVASAEYTADNNDTNEVTNANQESETENTLQDVTTEGETSETDDFLTDETSGTDETDYNEPPVDADFSSNKNTGYSEPPKKRRNMGAFFKSKKFIVPVCIIFGLATLTYFGGVLFYNSHFQIGTHIGSYDCANMSPEDARNKIQEDLNSYTFTFYEANGQEEVIRGDEIGFANSPLGDFELLRAQQNPFTWFIPNENTKTLPIQIDVSYNEDALYNKITEMQFMAATRQGIQGKAQNIHYADGVYTITDDSASNIVSLIDIFTRVKPKIYELYKGMSLEKEGCYGGLANDDTIKGVLNLLNGYAASKVVYSGSTKSRVLDASTFTNWITVADDYSIHINRDVITEYVDDIAMEYNSVGRDRAFKTTGGSEITVSGGNYGWVVNKKKEADEIYNNILSGVVTEREPFFSQTAGSHGANDIGNTYAEVSISGQHMWYYKNGELVVSSDCVTGNPNNGHATPGGVYYVAYKARDQILRGQDYASPVSYWMPFNGGIGFHDATWRGAFGGSIYRGGGSHGCVNLPFSVAQTLFANISAGDPVVVY